MPSTRLHAHSLDGRDHDVFLAVPDAPGPAPAVLVFHAWSGRKALEESVALRLAELGYVGAAVDLYGVGRRGTDRASCQALMGELTSNPPTLRARIRAALQAVAGLPEVDVTRTAAVGYCFGGLCAILAGRLGLPLRGVVSFHGLLKVGEPIDASVSARFLVLHGADDPMVSAQDIAAFATEMQRIGAEWQLHAYAGVMHAFTNPAAADPSFGTVYDADADRRSWAEARAFLDEVFADPPTSA